MKRGDRAILIHRRIAPQGGSGRLGHPPRYAAFSNLITYFQPYPLGGSVEVHWYTEDDDRQIVEMLNAGANRYEIADRLGRSRNSICGRISRLGLSKNARPRLRPVHRRRQEPESSAAIEPPATNPTTARSAFSLPDEAQAMDAPEIAGTAHPTVLRDRLPEGLMPSGEAVHADMPPLATPKWSKPTQPMTCAFPIDQPGRPKFRFCGKPVEVGRPYCSGHCRVAYITPRS